MLADTPSDSSSARASSALARSGKDATVTIRRLTISSSATSVESPLQRVVRQLQWLDRGVPTPAVGLGLPLLDDIEYPHARLVHNSALNSAPEHTKGG